jgi:methionyl-tRNA formyltransferase
VGTVFIGTSEFAAAVLECLATSPAHRPALVISRPDRPAGRGRSLRPPPVAERARALGVALRQPESVNSAETRALISGALAHGADGGGTSGGAAARPVVVVCAFGALIKEPLLSEHELLNVHPSLLPRWRGAAPIERAIMAGDERTGVSIMRLEAGLDSGPVCVAAEEAIAPQDDYGSLAARLQALGGRLILHALDRPPTFAEQPEDGATYAEKITAEDRLLDPARPAQELERVVRALHPHIGARVQLADGSLLGVHRASLLDSGPSAEGAGEHGTPQGLFAREGRLLLGCSRGVLELLEVQPPGARAMDAASYLRGHAAPGRR